MSRLDPNSIRNLLLAELESDESDVEDPQDVEGGDSDEDQEGDSEEDGKFIILCHVGLIGNTFDWCP